MCPHRYALVAVLALVASVPARAQVANPGHDAWAADTARRQYASVLEQHFLANGMDMHVTATGASLTLRYTLMSRPLVYQLTHNEDMLLEWRVMEFAAVFFQGSDETWRFVPATGELTYKKR